MRARVDRAGLTLLEALVGLAVVGGVLTAALGAAGADLHATTKAVDRVRAASLADHVLARGMLLARDSVGRLLQGTGGRFPAPLDRYRWRVVGWPVTGAPGLLQLRATIWWSGGSFDSVTRVRNVDPPARGDEVQ